MTHPSESQLVAFLDGACSPEDAAALDAHLIACEACWSAVRHDRLGRRLAESLRTEPSPEIADRVRLAVELHQPSPIPPRALHHGRARRRAGVGLAVVAGAATGLAWALVPSNPPSAVAAVVDAARALPPTAAAPGGGATSTSVPVSLGAVRTPPADQPLRVERYRLGGGTVLVAVSPKPFPMPSGASSSSGAVGMTWTATVDGVDLYCVNGREPMLVAGRLPAARLAQLAAAVLRS